MGEIVQNWAAPFLAGCVLTGGLSYLAMWAAFIKDAVKRDDVERIVDLRISAMNVQIINLIEQQKTLAASMGTVAKELELIQVRQALMTQALKLEPAPRPVGG